MLVRTSNVIRIEFSIKQDLRAGSTGETPLQKNRREVIASAGYSASLLRVLVMHSHPSPHHPTNPPSSLLSRSPLSTYSNSIQEADNASMTPLRWRLSVDLQ
ncbi:hypothetical protein EVAR_66481_1 [Eumeta japonica]|uniref:Uncharacterized protein n=1 Tax=Eumeta variegata TaxID=151549 RepID=A0A4C1ZWV5_EUMVA|nr:hypothetical protein EVAR_66481_1 [Eumeta japonica]